MCVKDNKRKKETIVMEFNVKHTHTITHTHTHIAI